MRIQNQPTNKGDRLFVFTLEFTTAVTFVLDNYIFDSYNGNGDGSVVPYSKSELLIVVENYIEVVYS